jgi:hypothetical protein
LTIEVRVKELVVVDTVRVFEVDDATRLVRSVEVATPLMVVVRVAPEVERAFDVMILDVAVTPLMVVVRTLPVALSVKELMMLANEEEIPFTITWKTLAEEDAVLEVMMVDVPMEPPMLEVRTLPEEERELEVVRLVTVSVVRLAELPTRLPKKVVAVIPPVLDALPTLRSPVRKVVPETERLEVDALVRVDCPDTDRVVAVVVAKVEVPVTERVPPIDASPVVVAEVNVGVADTAMVEVPENMILAPAVK